MSKSPKILDGSRPFNEGIPTLTLKMDIDTTRLFEYVWAYRGYHDVPTHTFVSQILGSKDMEMREFIDLFKNKYNVDSVKITYEFISNMCWRALFYIDSAETHSLTQQYPDLIVFVTHYNKNDSFSVLTCGDPTISKSWEDYFNNEFRAKEIKKLVTATGVSNGAIVDVEDPIKEETLKVGNDAFYPFIEEGIDELVESFIASDENLMLFIGEWGTGKTTLSRTFMVKAPYENYGLCKDAEILKMPGFNPWLEKFKNESLIILEDADLFIHSREDGNYQMSGLLNILDGIITTKRKLIISTNLSSINKVDEALLRPGRNFRTIEFRKLTIEEANQARISIGKQPLPENIPETNLTLSEALNYDPKKIKQRAKKVKGFTGR